MKKNLICLVLLCVLSFSCMTAAIWNVQKEKPDLKLQTLDGDSSVLDGLQLSLYYRQGDLLWKLKKTFGAGCETETDILSESGRMSDMEKAFWDCSDAMDDRAEDKLYVDDMMSYYPEYDRENKRAYHESGKEKIRAFYHQTPPGEEAEETVPYLEIHTEQFGIDLYAIDALTGLEEEKLQELEQQLTLYIREQNSLPVTLQVLHEGSFREECLPDAASFSLICGDSLYLAYEFRDQNGLLLDYSGLPGGYGVYRIPLGEKEHLTAEPFLSLAPETRIEGLTRDTQENCLLVLLGDEEGHTVLRLDCATGKTLQNIKSPIVRPVQLCKKENAFVLLNDSGDLAVFQQDAAGAYQQLYCHSGEKNTEPAIRYSENMICIHEGKTVVLDYAPQTKSRFLIRVYDETGRIFSGEVLESLRIGEANAMDRPTPWRTVFGGLQFQEELP